MTKTLISCAAAASLVLGALAIPTSAEARNNGGALAAGIIGGLAVGALIGSAAANNGPYYEPGPVYYQTSCYWQHQRVWDGYGWRFARVRVCQ